MRLLAVDIGTGTQDIFLYDSRLDLENGYKLIVPSPTMIVYQEIRDATSHQEPICLSGVTMGGGPSAWGAEAHVKAGLPLFATPDAARSFNDDLEKIKEMGIQIVSEDEARRLPKEVRQIVLRDFDFDAISAAFKQFGGSLDGLDAVAVAVFDHGNAPPDVSDRQFRFDYLDDLIRTENRLSAFAFRADQIPVIMTRLQAVAQSAQKSALGTFGNVPLVIMDTAPAAVLGAKYDPIVRETRRVMIANIGNFHTLAFRLGPGGIEGVFEHHTGFLDQQKLERLLRLLASGKLTHTEVFGDQGHGALIYDPTPLELDGLRSGVVVTGPRRSMMRGSSLRPYFAVPFGDMMMAGCFGLLAATMDVLPEFNEPIRRSLDEAANGAAPWDVA
jgi:uncharacterized protein (DUF1786 family)